jgi:hypothetical protein
VASDRPSFWISSERIFDRTLGIFFCWKYSGVKRALSSLKWLTVEIISENNISGISYLLRGKPANSEKDVKRELGKESEDLSGEDDPEVSRPIERSQTSTD